MSQLTESEADREVIKSLLRHVSRITKGSHMTYVLTVGQDGQINRSINFEPITREEIAQEVEDYKARLKEAEDALALFDQLTTAQAATVEAPTEAVVEPEPAPVAAEPAPVAEPQPEATPAEQLTEVPAEQPQPEPAPVVRGGHADSAQPDL